MNKKRDPSCYTPPGALSPRFDLHGLSPESQTKCVLCVIYYSQGMEATYCHIHGMSHLAYLYLFSYNNCEDKLGKQFLKNGMLGI